MRYYILILLLFVSMPISLQNASAQAAASQVQGTLVRNILMEGFVLQDKGQFTRLFKPYRNKYLSAADIDTILQGLQEMYEQAGYQGLVSIEYQVNRKNLTFKVSLIK